MSTIYRQDAIDAVHKNYDTILDFKSDGRTVADSFEDIINALPPAQPERLTDDDFETIRIHLSAFKERLCNQHRWEEAEEYQRIIDRFMTFASPQSDIIRCRDCKHLRFFDPCFYCYEMGGEIIVPENGFCFKAERRTDV